MQALLERLELGEATTAEIKKTVADYEKKQWAWVDSMKFADKIRVGYKISIPKQGADLAKQLKAYWAASRKVDRMLDAMEKGDAKADPEKTRKAIGSLGARGNKYDLYKHPEVGADDTRLMGRYRMAVDKLRDIEQKRRDEQSRKSGQDHRDRQRGMSSYDKELQMMRGGRLR